MPIRIPDSLPARSVLEGENIFVMTEYRAMHQDIRPLNVLILNLMPTKIVTETQLLRKLSNTPLQIQVELLRTASYQSQHTDEDHLESFYTTFDQVKDRNFDGLIITGAPVEDLDFDQVDYWDELQEIMAWSTHHVHSTLHICWGAQAGLYFHHGIQKRKLEKKLFGVFEHRVLKPSSPLFRGFDDKFYAPHSRYTEVSREDILADYQVSEIYLAEIIRRIRMSVPDLVPFAGMSKSKYMAECLALLDEAYGSVSGYLRAVGLSEREMAALRAKVLA